MWLYIKNKERIEVGRVEVDDNDVAYCYSRCFQYLGKMVEKGKHIFVFDDKENFIGRYDGEYSYDKFNNRIGTGNYTYEFFYPSIDKIDFSKEIDSNW